MGKMNIISKKGITFKAAGVFIVPPTVDFVIDVELPAEIEKEASKDKILVKEFGAQAKAILDMTVKMVNEKIKIFEKLFQGMAENGTAVSVMVKNINGLNQALEKDFAVARIAAQQGVDKVWKELQDARKEWRKFKIKVAISIIATIATLAVSIAAMASSPWTGGAGAAFAIIGFIKGGVKLAQDIKRIAIGFEAARKELEIHLKVVEKAAADKKIYTLNEISAAIFNEFLGISQPSIKSAQTCFDTMKAKYAEMVVDCHDLSKSMTKIEGEQKKLKEEFLKQCAVKMKALPPAAAAANVKKITINYDKQVADIEKDLKKKEITVNSLYENTKKIAPDVKKLSDRMKTLELKDPKGLKAFREALKFAALGLAPLNGNGIADTASDLGMGLGGTLGGYAYDKLTSKSIDGTFLDAA